MTQNTTALKLLALLQDLCTGHTAVRCMQVQFSRMQPPYHPDPEAIEELVWFVLGQGAKTFSMPNGDVFVVYANDMKQAQMETFIGHLPVGSTDFMTIHKTNAQLAALIVRLHETA